MSKNILVIESSPRGEESFSYKLTQAIVSKLKATYKDASVHTHALNKEPFPHLDESHLAAFFAPSDKHTAADKVAIRHSDRAIDNLMKADILVLGVPMYNFSIPSGLKAWIDHIVRAGKTFKFKADGSFEALVHGKKVYVAIASGGIYSQESMKQFDFVEPYLKAVLSFIGITDVSFFRVEGTAIPGVQDSAFDKAVQSIKL